MEAQRAERAAARTAELTAAFPGPVPGRGIEVVSWVATAAFTVLALATTIAPGVFAVALVSLSLVYLLVGFALFALDIVLAAARSRTEVIGIGGLFFLFGAAPKRQVSSFNLSLAAVIFVAIAAAALRPFTESAFGVLGPVMQLGLSGLWCARHGWFPARPDAPRTTAEDDT